MSSPINCEFVDKNENKNQSMKAVRKIFCHRDVELFPGCEALVEIDIDPPVLPEEEDNYHICVEPGFPETHQLCVKSTIVRFDLESQPLAYIINKSDSYVLLKSREKIGTALDGSVNYSDVIKNDTNEIRTDVSNIEVVDGASKTSINEVSENDDSDYDVKKCYPKVIENEIENYICENVQGDINKCESFGVEVVTPHLPTHSEASDKEMHAYIKEKHETVCDTSANNFVDKLNEEILLNEGEKPRGLLVYCIAILSIIMNCSLRCVESVKSVEFPEIKRMLLMWKLSANQIKYTRQIKGVIKCIAGAVCLSGRGYSVLSPSSVEYLICQNCVKEINKSKMCAETYHKNKSEFQCSMPEPKAVREMRLEMLHLSILSGHTGRKKSVRQPIKVVRCGAPDAGVVGYGAPDAGIVRCRAPDAG